MTQVGAHQNCFICTGPNTIVALLCNGTVMMVSIVGNGKRKKCDTATRLTGSVGASAAFPELLPSTTSTR